VFVDTPGFQTRFSNALNRAMNRSVTSTLAGVDAIVLVVDAWERDDRDDAVLALVPAGVPVVLALNKVDRVKDRAKLARLLTDWASKHDFAALVPVSAEKGTQVKALADEVAKLLPESAPLHGPDELTDRPERFLAAELVREKLFRLLGDELPYTAAVVIDEFKEEGALRRISATIYVDRQGHKAIVIGEKGATLKRIGTEARVAMEELFGGKVFLELWVKVKSGWADSEATVRQWGYE